MISANALTQASPTEPTHASIPAANADRDRVAERFGSHRLAMTVDESDLFSWRLHSA